MHREKSIPHLSPRKKNFSRYIHHEHLVDLPYEQELILKNQALKSIARDQHWPIPCQAVIPSPRPRHYRTLSKRQLSWQAGKVSWQRLGTASETDRLLEAEGHEQIYQSVLSYLQKPAYRDLARHLHYLIIRGSYDHFSLILNIDRMDGPLVRKGKLLAEHLQQSDLGASSAFLYFDPTRSEYYLESARPMAAVTFKKLFGAPLLSLTINGLKLLYPPTVFSQINESILPAFIEAAQKLLRPQPGQRLIDLYCGYGFFSHLLADQYAEVWGVDVNGDAIRSAWDNHHRLRVKRPMHFKALAIDGRIVRRGLPRMDGSPEVMLLDPPFQGTEPEVIPALAGRAAQRVLHIFCNIDRIHLEIPIWQKHGYRVSAIQPVDMFPATAQMEMMVLLERSR